MNTTTDTGMESQSRASTTPTAARGTLNRITKGCTSDSNCVAMTT